MVTNIFIDVTHLVLNANMMASPTKAAQVFNGCICEIPANERKRQIFAI